MNLKEKIALTETLVQQGLDADGTWRILDEVLHASQYFVKADLATLHQYMEYLPRADDLALTSEQKYLQLLWEILEKTPLAPVASFSIKFRRIIAEKLFKRCGSNFIAEENVRFNFGSNIEVGDNVYLGRGVFIDSKGGVSIGSDTAIAEGVCIFTHTHPEDVHWQRTYAPVLIGPYVKIYAFALILPGVQVKQMAIVAAKSLVGTDVEESCLVAGIPAKFRRMRQDEGRIGPELEHIWLNQKDDF